MQRDANSREAILNRALETGRAVREGMERGRRFAEAERLYDNTAAALGALSSSLREGGHG